MSEMNELYYKDPYVRAFDATVLACDETKDGFAVVLDDTAFYPEGGGQPADTGRIGEAIVRDVRRKDGSVVHYTDRAVTVGEQVRCELDWGMRYDNMQNHTGEHVLTGVIRRAFGYDNVGFHMYPDRIGIDMSGELSDEDVRAMERAANDVIQADLPVEIGFPDEVQRAAMGFRQKKELTGLIRVVNIPGVDCCACCGTHVKTTREIGILKVLSSMRHRGGTRIEFVCGERALRDYAIKCEQIQQVSRQTSSKPNEVAAGVERLARQLALIEEAKGDWSRKYFALRAATLPSGQRLCILFEDSLTPFELKQFAMQLMPSGKAEVYAVLSAKTGEGDSAEYAYAIASPTVALRDPIRELNRVLNGRGGGRDIVQGTFAADEATVRRTLLATFG